MTLRRLGFWVLVGLAVIALCGLAIAFGAWLVATLWHMT